MPIARSLGVVLTDHYRQRCAQRRIPVCAATLVKIYGERIRGLGVDEVVYHLSALATHRAAEQGVSLRAIQNVAVVFREGHVAVTAYWLTEAEASRRKTARAFNELRRPRPSS